MSFHVLMSLAATGSILTRAGEPETVEIGVAGWTVQTLDDSGVSLLVLRAEPDAEFFSMHTSEDAWLAYVVHGSATLIAGSEPDDITDGMDCTAGSFITFDASTPHAWLVDSDGFEVVLAKLVSSPT
ncbi:hypothetical protein [Gilvimarinus agarilyticus]|uniref:hypothetical protein n=1 Tax=Gilvimarinus agarilyticus TaxID=679259 RepID=UPI00059F9B66|nr:hypothetical protein [Gilvimarinus agarilyticus]